MTTFVALLRGINLGKRRVAMADLRESMAEWGYGEVRTLLASGNVIFSTSQLSVPRLRADLESRLEKRFGFPVPAILRSAKEISALVTSDPFAGVPVDRQTRLYVSFLSEPGEEKSLPPNLLAGPVGSSRILALGPGHIISVVQVDARGGTLDLMNVLDRHFGDRITTRNWNTVRKIAVAASERTKDRHGKTESS